MRLARARAPPIPAWDAVRRAADDRGLPGQFVLTGSATPKDNIPIEAKDSARLHPIADF